jgi:hypothetical protein
MTHEQCRNIIAAGMATMVRLFDFVIMVVTVTRVWAHVGGHRDKGLGPCRWSP